MSEEEYKIEDFRATTRLLLENEILKNKIDRAMSFIGLLHNNLEDYTEYKEYTNIFNEMLKDIEEILGDKENES